MTPNHSMKAVQDFLNQADVQINGNRAWDINVQDTRFYNRVLSEGTLGLGESFMDQWWTCEALDVLFHKILSHRLDEKAKKSARLIVSSFLPMLLNLQTKKRSQRVAHQHYDLGNDLYEDMLGQSMSYTCAYWKNATDLDQAQHQKHDLVCRKLNLQKGEKILELGCGWGSFARFAAEHYGCELISVNISEAQVNYAKKICQGLPVRVFLADYRDREVYNPDGIQFDKVVSIGMCEHVGFKNYKRLMQIAHAQLKKHGLFLLHTIGSNRFVRSTDPWIEKYIFPGGVLPSIHGLGAAFENLFVMEDWHNFGSFYDKTLMAWHQNFIATWDKWKTKLDDRFFRMWIYYLLSCAGTFRARKTQLWQVVLSKQGYPQGYESIR